MTELTGYTYGSAQVAQSPLSAEEFALLKQSLLFAEEDQRYLQLAGEVLADQVEAVLDVWYGFVGAHSHLLHYFTNPQGQPITHYLTQVRQRFGQWILDTCQRPYDQAWLNYAMEIALRHHSTKKNQTDQVQSVALIPLRYMIAFIYPITATMLPFLSKRGHNPETVEKMYQAWFKAVVLQVALWSYPYAQPGTF
ncbi:MAG: protogloblin ApPgb [Chloroflexi bacterium CFX4]|nr:protogloblin ApPgb [Chloroflexi bacterium CFX4]MDL1922637.1 protogloblin ApPgb [Chloroflexi bacterium CFX3]